MSLVRSTFRLFSKHQTQISQQFVNKLHLSNANSQQERQVEEVRIPVPWGHLAAKWWGPQDKRPILCSHGLQDSCGTFDPLINLLPEDVGFLAFDIPGHGYSSRLPKGVYFQGLDLPILIRRIQKYFNWSKISLLGHSMGGVSSFIFTALYPDDVDMLIAIDGYKPFSKDAHTGRECILESIDLFLKYELLNNADTKPPSYTYEELAKKIVASTKNSIYPANCHYILERIIEKSDDVNKFHFSNDNRLKTLSVIEMQHTNFLKYAKKIKCPFVTIKASNTTYTESKHFDDDAIDILKANKDFQCFKIEGTHHVHVNEPEKVAAIVNNFLKKYNNVDRKTGGIKDEIKITKIN